MVMNFVFLFRSRYINKGIEKVTVVLYKKINKNTRVLPRVLHTLKIDNSLQFLARPDVSLERLGVLTFSMRVILNLPKINVVESAAGISTI